MNDDDETWLSAVLSGLGCLAVAILFAILVLGMTTTAGVAVQFR